MKNIILISLLIFTSCGGSSGGGGAIPSPTNSNPPINNVNNIFTSNSDVVDFNTLAPDIYNNIQNAGDGNDEITLPSTLVQAEKYGFNLNSIFSLGNGNDTVILSNLEWNIDAGSGDDTIKAFSADSILNGGYGNDTISYSNLNSRVLINFQTNTVEKGLYGVDGQDSISNIENAIGTSLDDEIIGDSENNKLEGGDGNDILFGHGGNDILVGGLGDDILNGRGDVDYASYEDNITGVTVNLSITTAQNTGHGNDTLENIEGLIDGFGDDTLIGNDGDNTFFSYYGNDTLTGGANLDNFIINLRELDIEETVTITDFSSEDRLILEIFDFNQDGITDEADFLSDYLNNIFIENGVLTMDFDESARTIKFPNVANPENYTNWNDFKNNFTVLFRPFSN